MKVSRQGGAFKNKTLKRGEVIEKLNFPAEKYVK